MTDTEIERMNTLIAVLNRIDSEICQLAKNRASIRDELQILQAPLKVCACGASDNLKRLREVVIGSDGKKLLKAFAILPEEEKMQLDDFYRCSDC